MGGGFSEGKNRGPVPNPHRWVGNTQESEKYRDLSLFQKRTIGFKQNKEESKSEEGEKEERREEKKLKRTTRKNKEGAILAPRGKGSKKGHVNS